MTPTFKNRNELQNVFVLFCFVFCTEVPMDDIKSAVHRLRSYAQDAAQARQTLVQGVPGGSRGLVSGEGCKGEAPPENF